MLHLFWIKWYVLQASRFYRLKKSKVSWFQFLFVYYSSSRSTVSLNKGAIGWKHDGECHNDSQSIDNLQSYVDIFMMAQNSEAVVLVVGACGLDRLLVVPQYPIANVSANSF